MQTKTILIRGGLMQDAVHREPRKVDLLLAGGKIAAIGENLDATADAEVFDAAAYRMILSKGSSIFNAYGVTIMRVVAGTATQLFFTCTMAYALSKNDLPSRRLVIALINVAIVFPVPLVPLFLLVKGVGLYDSFWSMILPFAINSVYIFIMKAFYQQLPPGLEEAAMIDGGSQWVILLKVFLPVVKPTLAAVTLFTIVGHWNDYFSALVYITDTANYPLQTYIQQLNVDITEVTDPDKLEQLARISSRTLNSAKIVVSTIPLLMIYPFMQKYFVSGIVVGSVKE